MSFRSRLIGSSLASLALFMATSAPGANITWIGGTAQWDDGVGNDANWNPADEPDSNDTAIFNTNTTTTMGTNNVIIGLTMSASTELLLNGHQLTVDGATSLTGSGTRLEVAGATAVLDAADLTIANNSTLFIDGGSIESLIVGGANSTFLIDGGFFTGNGAVSMTDSLAVVTTLLNNNGTINASNPSTLILVPPAAATLAISATDSDARLDLDGSLEGGVVNINRNQTLDIDIQLSDIFNGTMTMAHETKLDIASSWILGAGAQINVDNGAVGGIPGVPAGKATIAGGSFAQNSGTISVLDADGTLQFDAPFSMNGGTLANGGHVIFNQTATIAAAANLDMIGDSDLTVEANRTVTINQTNFNFDGSGTGGTVITVNSQGTLILNVTDYDSDAATNAFDATITLSDGDASVTTGDAEFVMDGVLNMSSTVEGQIVAWTGEAFDLGNDAGSLDADLNVSGTRQSQFAAPVDFNADADVNIAAGATLALLSTVNFDTVNGGNNAEFTGAGTMAFSAGVNVNEAATLNMVGGTVDLDGLDNVGDFVNVDAPLVINAATMSNFGRANGGGGVNTLDVNNSVGLGVLTVNLDDPSAEWTLNSQGVMNLVNDNTEATLLAGSDVNVNGTVNVTGDVRTTARLDIVGTINVNTVGQPLRLGGGDAGPDVNMIAGGTVNGVGLLGADSGKGLQGYGTINADVDFDGTANLRAKDGTLTISGDIVDVNILGTADNTGVLNVTNPWETDGGPGGSIGAVVLSGGKLQGATITNDNATGLQGNGTINSRVINNSKIVATNGGTLIVQTVGNDNDWDGAANLGELEALSADLEMIDTTGPVPPVKSFGGSVRAINDHQVYANGFALNFLPGSSLELEDEATYRASSSTDIGGTVSIGAGADATIQVANNFFLTFETGSATTLDGNLTLKNNNINIDQGAVFNNGGGGLIIPDGSHIVADNLANIGVLLDMQGAFRPGNFNGIGRVDLFDYQQGNTGELYVELIGTSLNQFDRLVASGDVLLDGYLNIDIDEISPGVPFVPALGQTFNIITGNSVVGEFDYADVSGMPAGLAFHINYLANAVQLQVVNKPIFSADFDEDGDVDPTDLAIWKGAFNLNQLGDADGDNDSDGNDFLLWQQQFGSAPAVAVVQPAAAAVPEPSAAAMMLTLLALSALRAQRRAS